MTRIVGTADRSEIVLDPIEALRSGRVLDRILAKTSSPHPRGVFRGTHAYFEKLDLERSVETARLLNPE